jgi:phospholipid/cholesterol/gamma-HCH transport system permease protein
MEKARNRMSYELRAEGTDDRGLKVALAGRVSLTEADSLLADLERLVKQHRPSRLTVDLGGASYMDSAGVLALFRLEDRLRDRGISTDFASPSEGIRGIMALIDREGLNRPPFHGESPPQGILESLGGASVRVGRDFVVVMSFFGECIAALIHLMTHPRDVRWEDVWFYMRRTGAEALPIVGLISLLIGLIIAFMSSLQLKQFGANIYVASLVAVAIVRELGPIMTAILVAGRSASAYAAEIGSMTVNAEVDALKTMGYDPVRFLVCPKLIATVVVLPLLTLYADVFGILGGMIVGILGLDLTPYTYLSASQKAVTVFHLLSSLVKALVFAFVIAWIGCQRGFQVRGGVEEVGAATTSAVVTAILFIVVVDSAFAVVLHYIR